MNTPLDDIAFLARSANRVRILELLAADPHDRAELHEVTDIPRATVGRIVTDFQTRSWVTQKGRHYRTSPLGMFLAAEVSALIERVETMQHVQSVLQWLPTDEFDFPLDHFADAEITFAEHSDAIKPVRRATELFENAAQVRFLTPGFVPEILEARWRATVDGRQTSEAVLAADVVDVIAADPEYAAWSADIVRSDQATVHCYEGTIPYAIAVLDDVAAFMMFSRHAAPQAMISTTDEAIRSWVDSTIDAYRDEARLLDPDELRS